MVDTTKAYYKRGSGPLPLEGIEDYTAFSKAITSDETTFGKDPSLVMTYGDKIVSSMAKKSELCLLPSHFGVTSHTLMLSSLPCMMLLLDNGNPVPMRKLPA